ncbi:MAG TPA: hypothetical protein VIG33_14805 [Pseudobdellovibrionaceae bacterium]|jgi:hypothetical protein
MSVKGYPSNQKLIQSASGITHNYATVVPTDEYRNALDAPRFAFRVNSATVPRTCGASTGNALSGPTVVVDTSTVAKVGDIFRAETGNAAFVEVPIVSVSTNGFILASRLSTPPASGDTFYILRSVTQRTDENGSQVATIDTAGLATSAKQDAEAVLVGAVNETAPASDTASSGLNGRLQRIAQRITSLIALLPASIGQKAMTASFPVVLASDQASVPVAATLSAETTKVIGTVNLSAAQTLATVTTVSTVTAVTTLGTITNAVPTKAPVNANGSGGGQTSLTATTASSEAAPANAVGFILQADPANTDPIRYRIGAAASTVNGIQLAQSQDTGFIPCAATVSICATVSGTNKYAIQWILST